jgi:hypothetical protein
MNPVHEPVHVLVAEQVPPSALTPALSVPQPLVLPGYCDDTDCELELLDAVGNGASEVLVDAGAG